MARSIFIGDVHGCARELAELLEHVAPVSGDSVHFVGDLVARGPDTSGVLKLFRNVNATGVQGNHEARLLEVRRERRAGISTSKMSASHETLLVGLADDEWALLEALPLYRELPEHGVLIVHAGLAPGVPLTSQDAWTLTHIRSVNADGPSAASGNESWSVAYRGSPHVVFGHDARRGLQLRNDATGLDTACVYGGSLTALVLPAGQPVPPLAIRSDHLVSVRAHEAYYTNHRTP
ncbi:MAG TPA: metallophosphoesterase [Polyangiaceae bacterium]|jgi:hypothetical protein|nr:metallophosphoesterase [Polyangiaceae bacterium]